MHNNTTQITTGFRIVMIDALLDVHSQRERFFTACEIMLAMLDVYLRDTGAAIDRARYIDRLAECEYLLHQARGAGVKRFVAERKLPQAFCDVFCTASSLLEGALYPDAILGILGERGIYRGTKATAFWYTPEKSDSAEPNWLRRGD